MFNCKLLTFDFESTFFYFLNQFRPDRKWLYPFQWLKSRRSNFCWIFLSNSSEGARYIYLNMAVEKRNISGVYRYNWVSERITNKGKILKRSGEGEKGRYLPWSKEEEGAYIFWMKQVPVPVMMEAGTSNLNPLD